MDTALLLGLIGTLVGSGGIITAIVALRKAPSETRAMDAETYSVLEKAVADLSTRLSAEIEARRILLDEFLLFKTKYGRIEQELRGELHRLKLIVGRLRNGISRLSDQIVSLGHEPVWTPDEYEILVAGEEDKAKGE